MAAVSLRRGVGWWATFAALPLVGFFSASAVAAEIAQEQEARRALSKHCFPCHGPDASGRKARLRLDRREEAVAPRDGGDRAIDPESWATSLVWQRISSTDPEERMPPPESGPAVSDSEREAIRAWIENGAPYSAHWAFETPTRPSVPQTARSDWARNPIDQFILAALEARGLEPNPMASLEKRVRRVRLALTGLTALDVDGATEARWRDQALEALDSEQFGEHQARYWLDAARYGDTHGLHLDNERAIWPYRDWVVDAFNNNRPFDRFVIEQLAGDLLPAPTRSQLVATGFNRCNVTTSEGGAIPEEFAVRYAVDRVNTLGSVFMGMTVGCAQCHDHKFDPLTQKDYYQLFAIYNNLDENPMDGNSLTPPPTIPLPSPEQAARLAELDERIAATQEQIEAHWAALDFPESAEGAAGDRERVETIWVEDGPPLGTQVAGNPAAGAWVRAEDGVVLSGEKAWRQSAEGLTQIVFQQSAEGLWIDSGDTLFAQVYLDPSDPPETVMLQYHDGSWDHRAYWGADKIAYGEGDSPGHRRIGPLPEAGRWVRLQVSAERLGLQAGARVSGIAFTQFGGTATWDGAGIVSTVPQAGAGWERFEPWWAFQKSSEGRDLPESLREDLNAEEPSAALKQHFLRTAYAPGRASVGPLEASIAAWRSEKARVRQDIPVTMITREAPQPRKTTILERGEYDQPGEEVTAGFPGFLSGINYVPEQGVPNRLDLARWLVDPSNPLTARVLVNRMWAQVFGRGLVETVDDFGTQGALPSHPELLDWLAVEWVESGWDTKRMLWLMISSATFNQSSDRVAEKLALDPQNLLYSMGPRFRLDAEVLRDNALAIANLLSYRVGGRGVKPYQPEGLWRAVGYPSSNTAQFRQDEGEALYRRSLYTFLKRTSPPPAMTIFDAPNRESCVVRRERTNTPLQALVAMNDPQFVEAARHFGAWMRAGSGSVASRLALGFERVCARQPSVAEQVTLLDTFERMRARYEANPEAASLLLSVGDSPETTGPDQADLAAWSMMGNLLLNLDETLTLN